jgi:hypothetical protein
MKPRKFADEGFVREGSNENIDDETRDRARKFVDAGGSSTRVFADPDRFSGAKPKVVTKEELAKSGLSLREYMNKQQGLTPRGGSAPAASKASAPAKAATPMSREDLIAQIPTGGNTVAPTPGDGRSVTGSDLSRNISTTLNAAAGLKGVQMGQLAAEAAMGARAGKALSGFMGGKQAAEVRKIEPTMSTLSAAKRAELAGELRRGATPTKFTSPSKPTASKRTRKMNDDEAGVDFRKGGATKGYAKGGSVSSRADGIAQRGKTRGRMC